MHHPQHSHAIAAGLSAAHDLGGVTFEPFHSGAVSHSRFPGTPNSSLPAHSAGLAVVAPSVECADEERT